MAADEKNSISLHHCPQCGALVKALDKHIDKAHNSAKAVEQKRKEQEKKTAAVAKRNFETIEKARLQFLSTKVECSICSAKFALNALVDHCFRVHNSHIPADMRAIYGLAENKNMFKTTLERETYWKKTSGIASNGSKGEDIFDRGMTVQGGAYGLGKSRKH